MKIIVAGDFAPYDRVVPLLEEEKYGLVFDNVRPYIIDSDYSIVNFECPIVNGKANPIPKKGPCLKCSDKATSAIKYAGFKCATLANNHFRDYGDAGCRDTIEFLDASNIDHVGGGMSLFDAQRILYKKVCGRKIGIINFCENEFSIASSTCAGSAPMDLIKNYQQIQEARLNSDYVIVIVHGGHEYYQLPSPRMKETYRWFIEIGADVVINHHQHCYSGYEVFHNKPIFYGLGNFCFDGNRSGGKKNMWHEGYMVELDGEGGFTLLPYIQCKEEPSVTPMTKAQIKIFTENIEELNSLIQDDAKLNSEFEKWCEKRSDILELMLTPYSKRFFTGLWRRHLLPSFLPQSRVLQLRNMTECESHRDTFYAFLKKKTNP